MMGVRFFNLPWRLLNFEFVAPLRCKWGRLHRGFGGSVSTCWASEGWLASRNRQAAKGWCRGGHLILRLNSWFQVRTAKIKIKIPTIIPTAHAVGRGKSLPFCPQDSIQISRLSRNDQAATDTR